MTTTAAQLESSLVWDQDGHLADAALGALVDGELDLLPEQAVAHAAGCRSCDQRLGHAALLAVEIAETIANRRFGVAPARRPLPVAALVGALAVALVGLVLAFWGAAARLALITTLVGRAMPVLARGLTRVLGEASASGAGVVVAWGAAALLVMGGIVIARRAPVVLSMKGSA